MPTPEIISQLEKQLANLEEELIVAKWEVRRAQDHYERVADNIAATKRQLVEGA